MKAYVENKDGKYFIRTVEDSGKLIESTTVDYSDYDVWKKSNTDNGVEIVELMSSDTPIGPTAADTSSDVPPPPEDKQSPQKQEEYKQELSAAKLYSPGPPAPPPPPPEPEPAPEPQTTNKVLPIDAPPGDNRKLARDPGRKNKESSQKAQTSGLLDRLLVEQVPEYKPCQGDIVRSGKNNQWIVFGRDRPGGYTSGYGPGEGDTQAAAIDIVVGRMSPHPRATHRDGERLRTGPIFNYDKHEGRSVCDAARIYISQKTDMDHNFKLAGGRIGKPKARSGICLKSDGVRIIARDSGIKLVTHNPGMMNSQGGVSAKSASGIDIIAGNDDSNLQPMILGDNLYACLQDYAVAIDQVIGTLTSLIQNVAELDVALSTHIHPQSYPPGVPNIPSPNLAPVAAASLAKLVSLDTFSTYAEKWKLETIEKQYLATGGIRSIRSKFNNVN